MKLKVKVLKLLAGRPVVVLHFNTAGKLSVRVDDRVLIERKTKSIVSVVDVSTGLLKENEIAVSNEVVKRLNLKDGDNVEVNIAEQPESIELIHKKLECHHLNKKEVHEIIQDIVKNALTETEIAYFVSAVYKCGMSMNEVRYLIDSIVSTGKKLKLKGKIADKHSIGGVAGNRTSPIVISICAAAGLTLPKTSSRAITSAAGTADVIETISRVDFSVKEIYKIFKKTNACLVWGGSLGLAPADDRLIQIEKLLHLDPEPQLLASILSKKIAVGSKYVLIDIPYGTSAKVSKKQALDLKEKFQNLGKDFDMNIKCVLTDGTNPVGRGIGPLLEIRDILSVLKRERKRPLDLEKKSIFLSGQLLEMTETTKKGDGEKLAEELLNSGEALRKFEEIISAQKGDINRAKNTKLSKFKKDIFAKTPGKIKSVNNKKINLIARLAGSPADKGSGIYLYKIRSDRVRKNEKILTIYSESKIRLKDAVDCYLKSKPIAYL